MIDPLELLESELARLGADVEPKPGWQARVLAATSPPVRRRHRGWWLAVPVFAVAAVIAIVLAMRGGHEPEALALNVEIAAGPVTSRGATAKVGDTLRAVASGGRHHAIWVYRDDAELVIACPGAPACRVVASSLTAELTLRTPGRYVVVALGGDAVFATPSGPLDREVAAAESAGARTRTLTLDVQ